MRVAQVVPLRRFPADRPWFDYLVPDGLTVDVGHLVEVPFGRQLLPGVVWAIADHSDIPELKPIHRLLRPAPVVSQWQHRTLSQIADWYFVSLGHIVARAVPDWPKKLVDEPAPPPPPLRPHPAPDSRERVWWYRDRRQVMIQAIDWLLKDDRPRLICAPTSEDVAGFSAALGDDRAQIGLVDSQTGERDYRMLYEQVRTGRLKKIIGTGQALLLPYPSVPGILLDQDDHPAHRQSEQHPRLDNRQTVALIAPQAVVTTPAPSLPTFLTRHPHPPAFGGRRQLAVLGQPGSRDWLTPDAEELIHATIQHGQSLLAIVPHHGFAQRLTCRECGWTVTCQSCGSRVRLLRRTTDQADCQICGAAVKIPTSCPRCQAVSWHFGGLGVEQYMETIRHRWPKIPVYSADDPWPDQPGVVVGTYQAYRHHEYARPVLIISGDSLLSYPDYAVAERAWTYLARLQAAQPDSLVMIQTYEPDLPFWQRWRHGDDRSWYADELQQRTTLSLPPVAEHWIARLPNGNQRDLEEKLQAAKGALPSQVTITIMPADRRRWGRLTGRLLFQAPAGLALRPAVDWLKLFPPPWQLDPALRGWSD